jgi:hypothetical protein
MVDSFEEDGYEVPDHIKGGEFLEQLSDYRLPNRISVPMSYSSALYKTRDNIISVLSGLSKSYRAFGLIEIPSSVTKNYPLHPSK